ncbi:MAG TPA: glycosyltransferase family 1 protein [Candidatus Portnoybacteria bacterium]|uniref:Glycosyltransferase family 1 protein n=1 Tax=Candidatus Portnoybacteria bacterium CG02_land_8_20_14_3_00_45_8 TaxID=1974807 RepID=A0A2M7D6P3_9BACT|nr:MAG: glycosyltransferase family 1 protein [Candidatus Portnoybacteria bacterium CG02_land_8_20_14_3_00_45_8]HCX28115.1 glycosyltransferase family 1 protein [Candidatus Portnoybacteria bacterium]
MTIGVDLRVLAKGTRTGIEEYTLNLLSRLLSLDKSVKFKLFYNAWNKEPLVYDWLKLSNVELKKFRFPNRFVFDPLAKMFTWPHIDRLLGGADVFFSPHFLLSPVSPKCRQAITFHDLSFEYFPEFLPWRKRFWHASLSPKTRARQAQKIIAVSQSTKDDLVKLYGLPDKKIRVIYSGVGEEFKQLPLENCSFVKQKYDLPDNFILYFGTIEPRKNIVGLIEAYDLFRQKLGQDSAPQLVIAGQTGWFYKETLLAARRSAFSQDIIFTGFIEPSDKVYLFNLASLFVYPSFFEGFGFPPLEAMACGVPVICSNTSSFPEVVGEAALMIDPYNFEELAWAIKEVWQDNNLRTDLIARGLARAKNFSWQKCAKETLGFLTSS